MSGGRGENSTFGPQRKRRRGKKGKTSLPSRPYFPCMLEHLLFFNSFKKKLAWRHMQPFPFTETAFLCLNSIGIVSPATFCSIVRPSLHNGVFCPLSVTGPPLLLFLFYSSSSSSAMPAGISPSKARFHRAAKNIIGTPYSICFT